jgi:GH24 family phage-related lysozyme (muramidase)
MNKSEMILRLRKEEGVRNKRYKDTNGHWTIGVGWNLDSNPLPPDIAAYEKEKGNISDDMIDHLLSISIDRSILDCIKLWPKFDSFPERVQMALCDIVFNMGAAGVAKFRRMNQHLLSDPPDFLSAADELQYSKPPDLQPSKWAQAVGHRSDSVLADLRSSGPAQT